MRRNKMILAIVMSMILSSQIFSQSKLPISLDVEPGLNRTVIIQWTCDPGIDSFTFEIEKSNDKQVWKTIAQLVPQPAHVYYNIDTSIKEGVNYYRVRQLRDNGEIWESEIKWIQVDSSRFYLWPNPTTSVLHVKTPFSSGSINVVDSEGKLVSKITIISYITHISTERLSGGIYFLHIRHNKEVYVEKFIKD